MADSNLALLQTIAENTRQTVERLGKIDDHIIRLQKEKLDIAECDKILADSALVKKDLNDRLRIVEKAMWVGATLLGIADVGLMLYLKLKS